MSSLSQYKRGLLMDTACAHLRRAEKDLDDLLLSEDTRYATQEAHWQEGPNGARHCAASDKLRLAVLALRGLELPAAEDFG